MGKIAKSAKRLLNKVVNKSYVYDFMDDPHEFLQTFFNFTTLEEYLETLKNWHKLMYSDKIEPVTNPANILFDHKMTCNLVNAAWLLQFQEQTVVGELLKCSPVDQERYLNEERAQLKTYPKGLTKEELLDPYHVVKNSFSTFSLKEYHQYLYHWLNESLSTCRSTDGQRSNKKIYRNLRKLAGSCWLILQRESGNITLTAKPHDRPIFKEEKNTVIGETPEEKVLKLLPNLKRFMDAISPLRLNISLRKMLVDYLLYNINGLPTDAENVLSDFYWLTDFVDEIQENLVTTFE
ncbi:hypothetical protein [Pedobacter sp. ASV28]|uniref:hypothetical protein n=1 Tax=Pedobacter sp. ASV28 TaxID=2795123 RepID=UPI0018EC7FD9|nr:hypothetical protein [Pedobacter sp. ASV28]